jgi:hypothetical protein
LPGKDPFDIEQFAGPDVRDLQPRLRLDSRQHRRPDCFKKRHLRVVDLPWLKAAHPASDASPKYSDQKVKEV